LGLFSPPLPAATNALVLPISFIVASVIETETDGTARTSSVSNPRRSEWDKGRGLQTVERERAIGRDVVQLVFQMYDRGQTLVAIADELYRRAVPSPRGNICWTRTVIQRLLRNRRYVGDWTWGVHPQGKRHRFGTEGLRATVRGEQGPRQNPANAWIVVPDAHEPLVDRDQFERVQARLADNRLLTTPHVAGGKFVLNRLMVCGHCGSYLCGSTVNRERVYTCRAYLAYGRNHCFRHTVSERKMVPFLIRKLREVYLNPKNLAAFRAEASSQEAQERSDGNLQRLRGAIADLEQKIARGHERLLILPVDRIPGAANQLREWERELSAVQGELRRCETDSPTERLEEAVADAEAVLWRLEEALRDDDAPLLREVLRETIDRIELHWMHKKSGPRILCKLSGGVVYPRVSEDIARLSPSAVRRRWSRSRRRSAAGRPLHELRRLRSSRPIAAS
jgi:hypothetical protein